MSTVRKTTEQAPKPSHPPRPRAGVLNIAALHDKIAKRFPKVLAKLGE